jgi:hypothetical protein
MSQSGVYGSSGGGGTPITTLAGDVGTATGSTINVITGFVTGPYANGTSSFTGSGNTLQLAFNDSNGNIGIGPNALKGAQAVSASANTAIGVNAGISITGGNNNLFIGSGSGQSIVGGSFNHGLGTASLVALTSGQYNLAIGYLAGSNLTGVESANIYLNNLGVLGESNVLRIGGGAPYTLDKVFIDGIEGVSVGSVATVVSINSDQLGTTTLTAGSGVTITPGAGTVTISASGGGSGNFVLLQTQTAVSATSLTFTSGITSTYNNYKVLFDNVVTTTATFIVAQLSTDGGATYITTNYVNNNIGPTTGLALFSTQSDSGDAGFTYGNTDLYNLTSGSNFVTGSTVAGVFFDTLAVNAIIPPATASGYIVASTTVDAIQIAADDGSVFSGTFSLYGITT